MANDIVIKRSAVPGKIPTVADLELGELAVNTNDAKVYLKQNDGSESIFEVGSDKLSKENNLSDLTSVSEARVNLGIGELTADMTGFMSRTDSTISFDNATRTLSLTPTGLISVYYRGKTISFSSVKTIQIANTSGGHYIAIDPVTETLVDVGVTPSIRSDLLVAYIYWDATNAKQLLLVMNDIQFKEILNGIILNIETLVLFGDLVVLLVIH